MAWLLRGVFATQMRREAGAVFLLGQKTAMQTEILATIPAGMATTIGTAMTKRSENEMTTMIAVHARVADAVIDRVPTQSDEVEPEVEADVGAVPADINAAATPTRGPGLTDFGLSKNLGGQKSHGHLRGTKESRPPKRNKRVTAT
eukprot:GEMP01102967.1.p2 GENE.GEMP01102967.1~~GEMP01102967.1.p2  ORF type:complete len:146 (+),score=36.66 GEMP01102967.1:335-772(+)